MMNECGGILTMVEREQFHHHHPPDLVGKSVTVIGMGKSGVAASRLLRAVGANVTIYDERHDASFEDHIVALRTHSIRVLTGMPLPSILEDVDCVVVSPGVPFDHPALKNLREKGVPIIGEIELASWYVEVPLIAVTGTNGKSTTVRLLGAMLEECGKKAFIGGNVGIPLCEAVLHKFPSIMPEGLSAPLYEYVVAEVSSFQLETITGFHPWVSVLLNITPDHLDRHPSLLHYQRAKQKIFQNQTVRDVAVLNFDDPVVAELSGRIPPDIVGFSLRGPLEEGVYLQGGEIRVRRHGVESYLMAKDQILLPGLHNLANVLAASAVGILCGCPLDSIRRVVKNFSGVEHAMEYVRECHGVKYINDSKGTNVDATQKALESFEEPILLILGGKDKGGDFHSLKELVHQKVKQIIVLGEAGPRLMEIFQDSKPISFARDLSEAVTQANHSARAGDVVLLSPACASLDMFRNYDERGKEFKRLVHQLV